MARRTKADAEATRDRILEAASYVFEERGVSGASLEQIAERAGVTRGAVYWHFKNKTDVFLALYDRLHVPFSEMVLKDLETDHPDPLGQLEKVCVGALTDLERNPEKKRIVQILMLRCDYSGELADLHEIQAQQRAKNFKLFDQYFQRAKEKGILSADTDPQTLTLALFCYLTGIVYESFRGPHIVDLKDHAEALLSQFFRGIGRSDGKS